MTTGTAMGASVNTAADTTTADAAAVTAVDAPASGVAVTAVIVEAEADNSFEVTNLAAPTSTVEVSPEAGAADVVPWVTVDGPGANMRFAEFAGMFGGGTLVSGSGSCSVPALICYCIGGRRAQRLGEA